MSAKQLAKQYEFIVNASRDLMTLIDHNHIYVAANEAYCYAHSKARSEIVGNTVANVWGEARYLDQIKPSLDRCFAGEEVHYQSWFDVAELGSRFFDVAYYPYLDNDGPVTLVAVVSRDITQLKQTEEELQRRNRELVLLNQIIATSAAGVEPEAILETACRELTQVLNVSRATATLFNDDKTTAHVVAEYLAEGRTTAVRQSIPIAADSVFQHLTQPSNPPGGWQY